MRTGEIRYLCWNKSNGILTKPNLILGNGEIRHPGEGETTEYIFSHQENTFTVEHIHPKKSGMPNYYFVEVTDKDQQKSTWKMEQLPIPKYLVSLS
nr:hypothetical protein [uncultured Allomuricauda sp.]